MLRALLERGITPDLVSAPRSARSTARPSPPTPTVEASRACRRCGRGSRTDIFGGGVLRRRSTLARTRTHLHANAGCGACSTTAAPTERFEDLPVPSSASPRASRRVGALVPRAPRRRRPGLLRRPRDPAAGRIDDEHFLDGGIVNSIPVTARWRSAPTRSTSCTSAASTGRSSRRAGRGRSRWSRSRSPAGTGSSGHRGFPDGVDAHVLPTGQPEPPRYTDLSQFRYRDTSKIPDHIARAHEASARYLDESARLSRVPCPGRSSAGWSGAARRPARARPAPPLPRLLARRAPRLATVRGPAPAADAADVLGFAARHLGGVLACWVSGSQRLRPRRPGDAVPRGAHAVLRWYVACVNRLAIVGARQVEVRESEAAERAHRLRRGPSSCSAGTPARATRCSSSTRCSAATAAPRAS